MNNPIKNVFIGGASSDIGLATCRKYLTETNYKIIAHYRTSRPELNALLSQYENGRVIPLQLDFMVPNQLEETLGDKASLFENVDILLNFAADLTPTKFESVRANEILNMLTANLIPGILLTQSMGPNMVKRGWGRIVHISSIGVKFGGGLDNFAYSLSKHALEFMPQVVRSWAQSDVFTNVIRPGVTKTRSMSNEKLKTRVGLIPAKRAATVDEIAKAIIWFASEDNNYITNEIIDVAGGE